MERKELEVAGPCVGALCAGSKRSKPFLLMEPLSQKKGEYIRLREGQLAQKQNTVCLFVKKRKGLSGPYT